MRTGPGTISFHEWRDGEDFNAQLGQLLTRGKALLLTGMSDQEVRKQVGHEIQSLMAKFIADGRILNIPIGSELKIANYHAGNGITPVWNDLEKTFSASGLIFVEGEWDGKAVCTIIGGAAYDFSYWTLPQVTSPALANAAEPANEAYENASVYGFGLATKHAQENRTASFNDDQIDQIRIFVTANRFDLQTNDWIKGFRKGYELGGNPQTNQSVASKTVTRSQWRTKLSDKFGALPKAGVVACQKTDFVGLMGSPSRTQTIGDTAYWYYDCSDGTIQLEMQAVPLSVANLMSGKINDY